MSMAQKTTDIHFSDTPSCPHCGSKLPPGAVFCASCGTRLEQGEGIALLQEETDITIYYRITSLARRRPYASLLFAIDTSDQRPVSLRDIDISSLSEEAWKTALSSVGQEYDLLQLRHIPHMMLLIDVIRFQDHLYTIAKWPHPQKNPNSRLFTLHDVLQSGKGLPDKQIALSWIAHLCTAMMSLHNHAIIIGDLDPQAIILKGEEYGMRGETYSRQIALMPSWLPLPLRPLFPVSSGNSKATNFMAPEAVQGNPEIRSDLYSLGALLYLLLTGIVPEEASSRTSHRFRSPLELNADIPKSLDAFVVRALALNPCERFQNAQEMARHLASVRSGQPLPVPSTPSQPLPEGDQQADAEQHIEEIASIDTIRIVPTSEERPETEVPTPEVHSLQQTRPGSSGGASGSAEVSKEAADEQRGSDALKVQHSAQEQPHPEAPEHDHAPQEPPSSIETPPLTSPVQLPEEFKSSVSSQQEPFQDNNEQRQQQEALSASINDGDSRQIKEKLFSQKMKQRITGILPAIPRLSLPKSAPSKAFSQEVVQPIPPFIPTDEVTANEQRSRDALKVPSSSEEESMTSAAPSFFKQMRRIVFGEQRHAIAAAALIETPLRIQPDQSYAIRIKLTGRNGPMLSPDAPEDGQPVGLSSLMKGDVVHIEVRSALYQSYAYIVQQAEVQIPLEGYAAEVTIPMQPLSSGPGGRRDRLHIFFMDEMHRPLYEKPFVIELFISHLVQPGREGHNVLTIPV